MKHTDTGNQSVCRMNSQAIATCNALGSKQILAGRALNPSQEGDSKPAFPLHNPDVKMDSCFLFLFGF